MVVFGSESFIIYTPWGQRRIHIMHASTEEYFLISDTPLARYPSICRNFYLSLFFFLLAT